MATRAFVLIETEGVKSKDVVGDLITGKIHPIDGVIRTVTCLVIKAA